MSQGNYFTKTITTGTNTFTFSNPPDSGTVGSFTLELTHTGGTVDGGHLKLSGLKIHRPFQPAKRIFSSSLQTTV